MSTDSGRPATGPLDGVSHRHVLAGELRVHLAEQGEGRLLPLLHGWPESWYSWRHRFRVLADAGYHVVAPDQRGYGSTDQPLDVDQSRSPWWEKSAANAPPPVHVVGSIDTSGRAPRCRAERSLRPR